MSASLPIHLVVLMDLPGNGPDSEGHALGFLEPLLGLGVFIAVVAVLVAAYVLLRRNGLVPALPRWPGRQTAPEQTAKQLLAERFARGDISSDDFLERASVLNWTPGSEDYPRGQVRRR